MSHTQNTHFVPLNIAVLTISDTRTRATDRSGDLLQELIENTGHHVHQRALCIDDCYKIRAQVATWIADEDIHVIITTGGTGFALRDSTPEAIRVLFDKEVTGFGELFRHFSLAEVGVSTVQSRVTAGLANRTLICALPGSTNACRTGWEKILVNQLDARTQPCNFVGYLQS